MKMCLLCGSMAAAEAIDFGDQPLCNRFLEDPSAEEARFGLALRICLACGVVQLADPAPTEELRPRVDWLTYNEPEGHLDDLALALTTLQGIDRASASVCGISSKDDSLLRRLRNLGYHRTYRLDPARDLGIDDTRAGIETIQARLTPERAEAWVQRHGPADILIARHVLEHARDPRLFTASLRSMVAPGGYVIVELPDCEKALSLRDYTTVWEEHTLYFTPYTFHFGMQALGFVVESISCIPYVLENSLVAIMKLPRERVTAAVDPLRVEEEVTRARLFAAAFGKRQTQLVEGLSLVRRKQGRIVVFGAGHLACTFVNLFGLGGLIDCVVDDNPNKVGLFMPGSRLPIVHSQVLADPSIALCLLSINASGERSVMDKHPSFTARGGVFRSIFPASPLALTLSAEDQTCSH